MTSKIAFQVLRDVWRSARLFVGARLFFYVWKFGIYSVLRVGTNAESLNLLVCGPKSIVIECIAVTTMKDTVQTFPQKILQAISKKCSSPWWQIAARILSDMIDVPDVVHDGFYVSTYPFFFGSMVVRAHECSVSSTVHTDRDDVVV